MMIEQIYKALRDRIKTELPEIKHVDWYQGEFDFQPENENYPYNRPAVFLEFMPSETSPLLHHVQQVKLQLRVYLACDQKTDMRSGSTNYDKAIKPLELQQKLYACLNGYSKSLPIPPGVRIPGYDNTADYSLLGPLVRRKADFGRMIRKLWVSAEEYQALALDIQDADVRQKPDPRPKVKPLGRVIVPEL